MIAKRERRFDRNQKSIAGHILRITIREKLFYDARPILQYQRSVHVSGQDLNSSGKGFTRSPSEQRRHIEVLPDNAFHHGSKQIGFVSQQQTTFQHMILE